LGDCVQQYSEREFVDLLTPDRQNKLYLARFLRLLEMARWHSVALLALAATASGAAAFVTPVVSISAARIPVAKVVFDAFVFACGTDMVINCAWPLVVSSKSQMCEFDDGVRSLSIGNGCAWSRASAAWWQGDPDDG